MTPRDRKNTGLLVLGESTWGLLYALVLPATVLTVLLRRLGAGDIMIGLMASIDAGLAVLPQFIGNIIAPSGHRRKRFLVAWHLAWLVPAFFIMAALILFSPVIGATAARWGLIFCFFVYVFGLGTITSVWLDWMAHLFRQETRGRVLGLAWGLSFGVSGVSALLAGAFLRTFPSTVSYAWLYLAAAGLVPACMLFFLKMDDHATEKTDTALRLAPAALLARFHLSLADRNFRSFLGARLLSIAGFSVIPFITVNYASARGGGLSESALVLAGAALAIGQAVAVLILGRVGDRWGHRLSLLITVAAQVVTLFVVLAGSGVASCVIAFLGAGICNGGGLSSVTNLLFETCPHDNRLAHITAGNLVFSVAALVAPLAGGAVARLWGLPVLFEASLGISVLSLGWILLRLKEPRYASGKRAESPQARP